MSATAMRARLAHTRPGYPYSMGRTVAIYAGLGLAVLLAALDQTIMSTALPTIVSDLGGVSSYGWPLSVFLLCQTVSVPLYGKLGDIYGRRRLFFVSIPIFLAASALCGLSQNMAELIVARGIQGIGAGGVIPLAIAATAEIVPARERGKFSAMISSGFLSASVLGPAVGGLIVDSIGWRWVFYINLPVGGLALAVIALTMPRRPTRRVERIDVRGAVLLAGFLTALLLGVMRGGQTLHWGSVQVVGALGAALVLGIVFVVHAVRTVAPIIPLRVIRDRTVATGSISTALSVVCLFGATTYVPLFMQGAAAESATAAGLVVVPQVLGAAAVTVALGGWISRTGRYRLPALLGPLVLCAAMVRLATVPASVSPVEIAIDMLLAGIGSGAMMQTFMLSSQSAVPTELIGSATSLIQLSRAIGTTVGISVFGAIVTGSLPLSLRGHQARVRHLTGPSRDALAGAIHPAFALGAGLAAAVFVTVWFGLVEHPLRSRVGGDTPDRPGRLGESEAPGGVGR